METAEQNLREMDIESQKKCTTGASYAGKEEAVPSNMET